MNADIFVNNKFNYKSQKKYIFCMNIIFILYYSIDKVVLFVNNKLNA